MTLPLFLHETLASEARDGAEVRLTGDEARHAVVVKRLRVGEHVQIGDGLGTVALAEIAATTKGALDARVLQVTTVPAPAPRLIVVQAIPKGERAELAVEMLTEIGADVIVPWQAARCVAVWRGERADKSLARWRRTAREAGKQARRAWLPEVTAAHSTAEVAALLARVDAAVVLHEDATQSLTQVEVADAGSIALVVGPEGGIAGDELEALAPGIAVRLGSEVLRTSTAGVAAAAALLARTRRWGADAATARARVGPTRA